MKTYRFTRDVMVDGRPYNAGDTIGADEIGKGYLASCLRVGHLVEDTEPAPDKPAAPVKSEPSPAEPAAAPEQPKPKKK